MWVLIPNTTNTEAQNKPKWTVLCAHSSLYINDQIITLCEWCSCNTEDTSPVDPLRFIYFIFFLFVFILTYRPCIQGSMSRAGRRGWHMEEGHNQQLDSERCHHCHKYTVRILMAEKPDTHTEGEGGLASQKGAPFTSKSLLDTWVTYQHIIYRNSLGQEGNPVK